MTNFVGRLGVTLGLNSAEFTRGIEDANKKLALLQDKVKLYSQIAGASFVAASAAAIRYADEIVDVAQANEVAISSIVQLRNALASSGGEAGNASKLLSSFGQFVDKAAEGSFEAQKTLKGLGISLEDLKTLSMDELFRKAAAGLAAMEDSISRGAKGIDVFGKAAKGVDLIGLNDQLNKGTTLSKEHEEGIKAAAEAYDMLAEKGRRAMETLAGTIGPFVKSAIQQFDKLTDALKQNGEELSKVAKQYEVAFSRGGFKREGQEREVPLSQDEIARQAASFADMGRKVAGREVTPGINKEAEAERKRILDNWAKGYLAVQQQIREGNEAIAKQATELVEKEIKEIERRRDIAIKARKDEETTIEEGNRLLAEQANEYKRANAMAVESQRNDAEALKRQEIAFDLRKQTRYARQDELQLINAVLVSEYRYADAVREIRANEKLGQAEREETIKRQLQLKEQEQQLAKSIFEYEQTFRSATVIEGFIDAAITGARNATTAFEAGGQMFNSLIGNMEQAINRFVQTGKFAFKDFARSVIQELIAIQLRMQMMQLFRFIFSGIGPMSTSMGPSPAAEALPSGFNQYLSPRAEGGPVSSGSPYMVGERGPELFVPNRTGAIVPNNQLAGMMSGQTVNYNGPVIQNMSAIDTQSGLEFLVRNKQAVWAANQSAQRSLPMSR